MTGFVLVSIALIVLLAAGIAIGAELVGSQLMAEQPPVGEWREGQDE